MVGMLLVALLLFLSCELMFEFIAGDLIDLISVRSNGVLRAVPAYLSGGGDGDGEVIYINVYKSLYYVGFISGVVCDGRQRYGSRADAGVGQLCFTAYGIDKVLVDLADPGCFDVLLAHILRVGGCA